MEKKFKKSFLTRPAKLSLKNFQKFSFKHFDGVLRGQFGLGVIE